MSKALRKNPDSRRRLRSFKASGYPLLLVVLPLLPVVLFVGGLISINAGERGLVGTLLGVLASVLSPVGLVILLLGVGYFVHQRQLGKERMWRRKRLPLFARLRFRSERAPQTCAFCHDVLDAEHATCPGCAVALHVSCQAEALGCGTIGCAHEARLAPVSRQKV